MKHVEFYRNDKDGSVLVSVGTQVPEKLIYAGQELTHLVADTVDAAKEKHVPAIQKIDGHLEVHVGSVTHPMEEKHYIEWIALVDDNGVDIRYLKPGEEPKAEFETGDAGEVLCILQPPRPVERIVRCQRSTAPRWGYLLAGIWRLRHPRIINHKEVTP